MGRGHADQTGTFDSRQADLQWLSCRKQDFRAGL